MKSIVLLATTPRSFQELFAALTPEKLGELAGDAKTVNPATSAAFVLGARGFTTALVEGTDAIAAGIERLHASALPLVAVYAFAGVWELGACLAEAVSKALGTEYCLIEDLWAFRIAPGASGWPRHRGVYELQDRTRPEWINAWIALSDVEVDRSCMHLAPLDDDPAYLRGDLADTSAPGIAMPVKRNTALLWNANVLHWGGASAPTAKGPRVSITFTLVRSPVCERPIVTLPDPWERLSMVARQITIYGDRDPSITEPMKAWARATTALAARR